MKAFADEKLKVAKMIISRLGRVENIVKEGNVRCHYFVLLQQCYEISFYQGTPKVDQGFTPFSYQSKKCLHMSTLKDFADFKSGSNDGLCLNGSIAGKAENAGYKDFLKNVIKRSLNPFLLKEKSFENIFGKGENAGNQHFLLFPQCFLT